jgi:uncharacterized protein involved in exopolysaccharide biosynthesis
MFRFVLIAIPIFIFAAVCAGQTAANTALKKSAPNQTTSAVKSSPAYAELLLRRTEREAELEEFLIDYTDEFPKVKELKFEIELLQKVLERISAVSDANALKLSPALGKLLVRKTELEVELWNFSRQYNAEHPDVKRAKRKIEVYDKAIKDIFP